MNNYNNYNTQIPQHQVPYNPNYPPAPAPYRPNFNPLEYVRQNERKRLKKTSNGLGFYVLCYYLTMQLTAIILMIGLSIFGVDTETPTMEYFLDIFLSVFAAFIPGVIYLAASRYKLSDSFGKSHVKPAILLSIVLMGMGMSMLSNYAASLFDSNISIFGLQNQLSMTNEYAMNPFQTLLYIIAVSAVPAFAEEFAFRGIVMGRLRKYGNAFAIIVSSVMFGAMHGNTTQIIFAFLMGLIFGYVDCVTDSIFPSIIIHFVNNFYAVLFDVLQTNTNIDESAYYILNLAVVLLFCVSGILSFIYLAKTDGKIFKLSSLDKSENEYSDTLTYKEKIKSFFFTPGVIISLVLFTAEMIYLLIPNNGIS